MPNNVSRRHHYNPSFLLEKFADCKGNLWVYDALLNRKFKGAPSTVGLERDFYSLDGQNPRDGIEKFLAQEIDGPGADAIEGLINGEHLTATRAMSFMRFVAAQLQRTPSSLQRLSDVLAPYLQEMCERMARFDQEFRESLSSGLSDKGCSAADIQQFLQSVQHGEFKIAPSRDLVIVQSLNLIGDVATALSRMRWKFATLDSNDPDLILGDHPVILADVGPPSIPPRPLGLRNPHMQVTMPFHARKVALGSWDGETCYCSLAPGAATDVNEQTLRNAHRFVFASSDSDSLLEQSLRLHGRGPRVTVEHLNRGTTLVIRTEYT